MKTAFENADNVYLQETDLLKVDSVGTPERKILIDLESKDMKLHWLMNQNKLLLIIAITGFILAAMIVSFL